MDVRLNLHWDCDAGVLCATSADVPGLVIESSTLSDIFDQVDEAVPNLIGGGYAISN